MLHTTTTHRSLAALAAAALATLWLSTAAFADTLNVTLIGNWTFNSQTGVATGTQSSALTNPAGGPYSGTYAVNTNVVNECMLGPIVSLDYPGVTPHSTLALTLNSPLCPGSTVTFSVKSGTGFFARATGGGSVRYSEPATFNFVDSAPGGSFLGTGGGPPLGATPELDSVFLFGSGALGLAGYLLIRARVLRKNRST